MTKFRETDIFGVPVCVEYKVIKGDEMVMYYPDGSGYPGSPDEIHVMSIFIEGVDVYDILDSKSIETLEEELYEYES